MTVGMRISDVNALRMTGPGGSMKGNKLGWWRSRGHFMDVQIGRHRFPSCKDGYDKNLNTFQDRDNLVLIPANDISALRKHSINRC